MILFNKINLTNICWLFEHFFVFWLYVEFGPNQDFQFFNFLLRQQMLTKFIFVEKYDISAFWNRFKRPHMIFLTILMKYQIIFTFSIFSWFWKYSFSSENWSWLKITTTSRKGMVSTPLKSSDIIFYDKNNFVNTCWPHDAIFLFELSLKS